MNRSLRLAAPRRLAAAVLSAAILTGLVGPTPSAAAAVPRWIPAVAMSVDRARHTATALPDGRVLVTGGLSGNSDAITELASAEIYSPGTGRWTAAAPMREPRLGHTATLLRNGKVLVVGGASAEVYDPSTNRWTAVAAPRQERRNHTATLLPDGSVLITGGVLGFEEGPERYRPWTNTWTPVPPVPYSDGGLCGGHTATATAYGVVVVGGCGNWGGTNAGATRYRPGSGTWGPVSRTDQRENHAAASLGHGKVLVTGGCRSCPNTDRATSLFDPATNTWSRAAAMVVLRSWHTATTLRDGSVLVVGAFYSDRAHIGELYRPSADRWLSAGAAALDRWGHTATLLPDGSVLVTGGWARQAANATVASAELFRLAG